MIVLRGSLQTEHAFDSARSVGFSYRDITGAGPNHGSSMSFYLIWGEGYGNDLDGSEGIHMTKMNVLRGKVNVDNNHFYNYLFDCVDEVSTGHGNCFMTVEYTFRGDGLGSPDVIGPENVTDLYTKQDNHLGGSDNIYDD